MNSFQPALTAVDFSHCEREAINVPGAVQPFGALLATTADGSRVTHASANLAAVLGVAAETALERPPAEALREAAWLAAAGQGLDGPAGGGAGGRPVQTISGPGGRILHLQAHRSGKHVCIDIEPVSPDVWQRPPATTAPSILETFKRAASVVQLCELAAGGLKRITGYDRVMAYRFGADGHGEVIAEACSPGLEPYLGQFYPASDIPPQARQQYLRQRVGVIGDCDYVPVPLLTAPALDAGEPLDLAHSSLRSVSPVHREYMRNMRTVASLTIGLAHRSSADARAREGKPPPAADLWGMLVCHHTAPRFAGPEVRAVADTIGLVVSLLLGSMGAMEVTAQRHDRNLILQRLIDRLAVLAPLTETFAATPADLLDLVGAAGAVVRHAGGLLTVGKLPERGAAEQALATLHPGAGGKIVALDDVGLRYPALAGCTVDASGALLLPLGDDPGDAILWFRPEQVRSITWGGNPDTHAAADPVTGRISPRASFAAWKAVVGGRSKPWSDADLALANDLRRVIEVQAERRGKVVFGLLERVIESSPTGLVLASRNGRIRMLNRQVERMFGYRREALLDQPLERLLPVRLRETHRDLLRSYFADPVSRTTGDDPELFGQRLDGSEFPIEVGLDPVAAVDSSAEPMVLASIADVTLRREIEREKQRIDREADQRRRALERSNADLEGFTYAVSHDLKAPLRAIGHLAEWICEDLQRIALPDTLENLRLLQGRVIRMQNLLEGLLAYSKIGRGDSSAAEFSVAGLVGEIVGMLAPPPNFAVVFEGESPLIRTERIALQMVLENLIGNALKHHDLDHGRVVVSMRQLESLTEFRVTDDGPGVPLRFQERIFIIFQTLHSRDEVEASGIGLAIAKRHVETHGGRLWIESAPPARGSSFVFTWGQRST